MSVTNKVIICLNSSDLKKINDLINKQFSMYSINDDLLSYCSVEERG